MKPIDMMEFPGLKYSQFSKVSPKVLAGIPPKSKRKLTEMEKLEVARKEALMQIYKFYARQHIKNGITFDEQQEEQKIDPGELTAFCKDFNFKISKTVINLVFQKVSIGGAELELQQFLQTLKPLAIKSIEERTTECKYRLAEIKNVINYPENK